MIRRVADVVLSLAAAAAFWLCVSVGLETLAAEPQPPPPTVCMPREAVDDMHLELLAARRQLARMAADIAAEKARIGGRGVGR